MKYASSIGHFVGWGFEPVDRPEEEPRGADGADPEEDLSAGFAALHDFLGQCSLTCPSWRQ